MRKDDKMDLRNLEEVGVGSKEVLAVKGVPKEKEEEEEEENENDGRRTNYLETFMHLHKSNTGPGIFSMGDAFKNAGLLLAPALIVVIGSICVYCQHMMLNVCEETAKRLKISRTLGFEETAELCFEQGHPRTRRFGKFVGRIVYLFLCITQSGFCCVYIVFVSTNLKQIWDFYLHDINLNAMMAIVIIPMITLSWVQDLKKLAPVSIIANIFLSVGVVIVLAVAIPELPNVSSRRLVTNNIASLPLFYGSVVYTFEGIGLITPLKKRCKRPDKFASPLGPLNVAMMFLTFLMILIGFIGYLRWGDDVQGSLTLNLDEDSILAQCVKILICFGVLFSYPLQLSPAITLTYSYIEKKFGPFHHPLVVSIAYRTLYTILLFTIAEVVPHLALFISLIGAVSSTTLALIVPAVMDLVTFYEDYGKFNWRIWKNVWIILFGVFGFVTGTFYSLKDIIDTFNIGE